MASRLLLPVWLLWTPVRKEGGWKESFKRRLNMCNSPPERFKWRVFSQIERTPKQHMLLSSPPTPSALTFTCFLSPELRCEATLFLSLFLFWYEGLGLKRFHLSFLWVTLVYYYCQFPFRNVQKTFFRCISYSCYYTTSVTGNCKRDACGCFGVYLQMFKQQKMATVLKIQL